MKKLLMASLAAIALVGTSAALAVAGEGYGGAPNCRECFGTVPPMAMAEALNRELRASGADSYSFSFIADECKQTLEEAAKFAADQGWVRLADFKEPGPVGLLTAYLSMRMEKSLSGDMVTAFERGPEGLLMLTGGGCVTGIMGGLKPAIDKALAEFRANGPAA